MTTLQPVPFKKPRAHAPRLSEKYVPGKRHKRFWSKEDDAVVRTHYPTGGIAGVQAHLSIRRGESAIYQRAQVLGLKNIKGAAKKHLDLPPDIDDRLRAEWPLLDGRKKGEVSALADRLGVPRHWITDRATKLGLTIPHMKEPPWTAAEEALMKQVPLHDPDRAAKIFREHGFKRSPTAIVVKAQRLSLSRRTYEHLSAGAAAKILGIDTKAITSECIAGRLKAGRRKTNRLPQQGGDPWSIARADFRAYIVENLGRIDFRKVDKFALVDVLVNDKAQR